MEALIEGQTIKFDIHAAGNREPAGVKDLHMHKRMNGRKHARVQVRFPLRGRGEPLFTPPSTNDEDRRRILNEVKRVLKKDPQVRERLVNTVIDEIERFGDSLPKPEVINAIRRGSEKIAEFFGDDGEITEEIMSSAKDRIKQFTTRHRLRNGHWFFVRQDFEMHAISLSDSLHELNSIDHPRLIIVSATYGARGIFIDVTGRVKRMVDGNTLLIKASNKIGGDPVKNVRKTLTIQFRYDDGPVRVLSIREGRTGTIEP